MSQHQWLASKLIQGKLFEDDVDPYLEGSIKSPTIFVVAYWCPDCQGKLYLDDDFHWTYEWKSEVADGA